MDCDHSAPPVFKGGMWVCSRCDTPVRNKDLGFHELHEFIGLGNSEPEVQKICTCGAEKLWGKPAPGNYPDCEINDKKK